PTTRRCASERTSWGPWACSRSRPSSSASTSTGCSAGSRSRAGSSPAEGGRPVAAGTLYVVATPIGNLEDVTLRALRVLREVDLIAAEDTRRTRILLDRHGIARPLTAYYDAVERARTPGIVARLVAGESVALVSHAGTPRIVGREITKRYEEILRGRLGELLRHVRAHAPRGEVTVLIEGAAEAPHPAVGDVDGDIRAARAAGRGLAELSAEIARRTGRPRRE